MSHKTGRTVSAGCVRTKPAKCTECGKRGLSRRSWSCRYCGDLTNREAHEEAARRAKVLADKSRAQDERDAASVQLGDDGKVRFAA